MVVSVIALLAALLLPSLSRAKAIAYRTSCRSNLHQIGLAAQMYLGEFHRYPIDWEIAVTSSSADGTRIESGSLMPYLSNHRVFYCPVQEDCPGLGWAMPWPDGDNRYSGYGVNANGTVDFLKVYFAKEFMGVHLGLGVGYPLQEIRDEMIRFPCEMIAYGDCFYGSDQITPHNTWTNLTTAWQGPIFEASLPSPRHLGGANVLLCDGHVEFHTQSEWITPTDIARSHWNNDHQPHRETW